MYIIGHQKERERLKDAFSRKKIAQSYLFFGPRGIGKSMCALEFATLLANESDFEPTQNHPYPFDVMVMQPKTETKRGITKEKSIAVKDIREALSFLATFPVKGGYRVVIIEDAHLLSLTAQNALLKTLEEPNTSSVIILLTHEPGSILQTILSRVERVRFDFVPEEELRTGIEHSVGETKEIAPFFFSLGRPGMILHAFHNPETFAKERVALGQLFRLSTLSATERLSLAEALGANVPLAVRLLEWWLPGLHAQAFKITERGGTGKFFLLLESVERTLSLLKTTQSNARLLLEKLFLSV